MKRTLALLAVAACEPPDGDPAEQGELRLAIVTEPDEDLALATLTLRIEELVFTGVGPDGLVSVSVSSGARAALVGGASDPLPAVALDRGAWREVRVEVHLRGDAAGAGVECSGVLEETAFALALDEVRLEGDESTLAIGATPRAVTVRLRPGQWFDGIDLEDLAESEEDEGDVWLDALTHPEEVDRIHGNLIESTEVSFDASEEGDD